MNVSGFLTRSAKADPDKVALTFEGRDYSYEDIDSATDRIASRMNEFGVRKGDRVLVATGNVPETVLSIFGTAKSGGIFVPVNPKLRMEKFRKVLMKSDPKLVVFEGDVGVLGDDVVCVSTADDPGDALPFEDLMTGASGPIPPSPQDDDVAAIMFTSGSTGDPKGVTLTNRNIDAASDSIITYLENVPGDIILDAIPLSFDYGLYQVLMSFKFGGKVVLERSFVFFNELLQRIEEKGVTGFPIVPSMAEILIRKGDPRRYDISSVRYITNTAQALNPNTILSLRRFFVGARIYSMYGLTECKRVSYLDPEKIGTKPTSVGKAIPNTEMFLLDEGMRRIGEPGRIGELAVKGPHIMVGYWNDPESTAKVIIEAEDPRDRILLTGDLFSFDEDGDFYYVGRKDEMLKIGGEKASPIDVERVVGSIDGITACVVVGVPDPIMGNSLVAVVVSSGGVDEPYVKRVCTERLERHLVPKQVVFVKELPLTQNGKVDRRAVSKNIEHYQKG